MRIKAGILDQIKESLSLRNRLAYELNCSPQTILRWLDSNSPNLTWASSLSIIRDELKLTDDEILEDEKAIEASDAKSK